jgi:transcriptional regulator with XRE-family HTH domain
LPRTTTSEIASQILGHEVRRARVEARMTQREVAERLKTSPPYISAVESGRTNMTVGQVAAIADALGVELHIELRRPPDFAEPEIPAPVGDTMATSDSAAT